MSKWQTIGSCAFKSLTDNCQTLLVKLSKWINQHRCLTGQTAQHLGKFEGKSFLLENSRKAWFWKELTKTKRWSTQATKRQTDKFHLGKTLYLGPARTYLSEDTLLIFNIYSFLSFKKITPKERLLSRKRDFLKFHLELPLLSAIFSFDRSFLCSFITPCNFFNSLKRTVPEHSILPKISFNFFLISQSYIENIWLNRNRIHVHCSVEQTSTICPVSSTGDTKELNKMQQQSFYLKIFKNYFEYLAPKLHNIWDKVFKNEPSKIPGRQSLKSLKQTILQCFKQTILLQIF